MLSMEIFYKLLVSGGVGQSTVKWRIKRLLHLL